MKAFFTRVKDALQGWLFFFSNETNGQIQMVVALLVALAGWWLKLSSTEWMVVLLCMGLVLALEMVNSAIEKLCDHLHPDRHPVIGKVKDMAAGAVLWAAVMAVVVGLIVFVPKLMALMGS